MVRASARKLLALWLGFFFALNITLSAAQAGAMTCDMGMAAGMEKSAHAGNPDCAETTHKAAVKACLAKCVAATAFVLPEGAAKTISLLPAVFTTAQDSLLTGRVSSPDPPPPRPVA